MENNTVPAIRFVRCFKCFKLLTESSEIPVYKCGGCGAIIRAKARSNSAQNLCSESAISASQNLPDSDCLSNGSKNLRRKTPDSDATKVVEQTHINNLNVSESISENICDEISLEHEQTEIKNLPVSEFNGETDEAKREASKLEGSRFRERLEAGNEELEKSPNVHPEISDNQKSNDKLEDSSEPTGRSANSEEDSLNMEFINGAHFRITSGSSSQAYEGSVSSPDEDRKYRIFHLSRRTFRNKNASNSTTSTNAEDNSTRRFSNDRFYSATEREQKSIFTSQDVRQSWIDESSSSPAKDVEVKIDRRFSEQDNQVNILSRVDELRNELTGLFNGRSNSSESSLSAVKKSQFRGKLPSKEHRSSLIPFSIQPSSSLFHNSREKCCHNEHCRPCPHNVCCHLSEPAIPQNLQLKVSRAQNKLCRPVSGGAPFVICYKCFKLLQLPVDFLVSPKRVNKLRCGACSEVLMYFFKPRTPSIPQTPAEDRHPPSEENDELNVVAENENFASRYEDITAWDLISSSESNSGEVKPALPKSRSFDERVDEEKGEGFNCLRLHNLMGYSSASELLFNNGNSHDEYQSTDTLKICRPSGRKRWERHCKKEEDDSFYK
ncbi:protein ENHANCED DISEASE RESISTANCE 4-like [Phalaenopsis equestris]|uniref:protein ENHANCED DISEASE RESISTANCE 4-like n=1 Tax=Phalaenopsis equestris TaxID=78828 RepID=UPI0009E4EF83|nr:protein ENHANCED DISEASE RESISTANCE 4-like [Phalaenopsis equestris]